jgi:hypothetical protein
MLPNPGIERLGESNQLPISVQPRFNESLRNEFRLIGIQVTLIEYLERDFTCTTASRHSERQPVLEKFENEKEQTRVATIGCHSSQIPGNREA